MPRVLRDQLLDLFGFSSLQPASALGLRYPARVEGYPLQEVVALVYAHRMAHQIRPQMLALVGTNLALRK